jgi:hypothetical protein
LKLKKLPLTLLEELTPLKLPKSLRLLEIERLPEARLEKLLAEVVELLVLLKLPLLNELLIELLFE